MTKYDELQEYLKGNQHTWLITWVARFIGYDLFEKLFDPKPMPSIPNDHFFRAQEKGEVAGG